MLNAASLFQSLRRLQGRRLWGAVLLAALLAGVGVVLSNRYAEHQLAEVDAALIISSQRANQFGVALAGALLPTQEILERYAQDPRVVTALGGADDAARVTLGAALAAGVPGALRLRLIPAGAVEPDTLGCEAVEMRRAHLGRAVAAKFRSVVLGNNEKDVRAWGRRRLGGERNEQEQEANDGVQHGE